MAADPQVILERVLTWSAVLIGMMLIAAVVLVLLKRRHQGTRLSSEAPPFSLHELRKLHAQGKLSDEEFDRARQAIIGMTPGVRGTASLPPESKTQERGAEQVDEPGDGGKDAGVDESPPDEEGPGPDSRT